MGVRLPRLSKPGLRIERVRRPRGGQERGMGWSATGNGAVLRTQRRIERSEADAALHVRARGGRSLT